MRLLARSEGLSIPERTSFSQRFVTALITFYQRRVSPFKGFRCAHHALHGGPSCSEYIKQSVATEGLIQGFNRARKRFAACNAASRELSIMMAEARGSAGEPGKGETPEQRTKRCAAFTPATCCLTGFVFH